jgi:hypothetical protein
MDSFHGIRLVVYLMYKIIAPFPCCRALSGMRPVRPLENQ